MDSKKLEERLESSSELPPVQAIEVLRDVVLGNHPNDAESLKSKELVSCGDDAEFL